MSENLEEQAATTFHSNIQYLAHNHRSVYNKLLAFDKGIEDAMFENKYELILREEHFDIYEFATNKYLYDSDSNTYADLVSKSLNFQRDSNVFETFKKLPTHIESEHFIDIAPTLEYIKEHSDATESMEAIKKFIFFGVGLGTHIMSIDKKINAGTYLIVEDNIELFKHSLFVTPYYELGEKSTLMFSIFDSSQDFEPIIDKFLTTKFYHNHYLKYFEMLNFDGEKLKEFHLRVAPQTHNIFFYKDILTQYLRPLTYMQKNLKFLNLLQKETGEALSSKPVIMLAAGPSLEKNIEWLQVQKDNFIIVALSSVLAVIEKAGIVPDILIHMDAFESSLAHFKKLKSLKFLDSTLFLFSARMDDWILDNLKVENMFFYENGTSYKKDIGNLSAPCVGSTTYLLLLALGVKELYLLGLDLALDSQSGATHSQEHHFNEKLNLDKTEEHLDVQGFSTSVIKTAGNFSDEVYTTPVFMLSIKSINDTSLGFKQDTQNVYNLNDGVAFSNTISTSIDNIELEGLKELNKKEAFIQIKESFTKYSSIQTSQEEMQMIRERVAHAVSLKEHVLSQQNYYFTSDKEFLGSLILLFERLTTDASRSAYDISFIFQEFFKLLYPFIFDFFNIEGLKNKEERTKQINLFISNALLRILSEYNDKLEEGSTL